MARKRMIDPTIWEDENFGELSVYAKLLFIGLFSNADDEGRIRANPAYIKSTVFMYDDLLQDKVEDLMNEVFSKMKSVKGYLVDGKQYIQLLKWSEYQKQHKDRIVSSTLPPYKEDVSDNVGQVTDNVGVDKVKLSKDSIDKDSLSKVSISEDFKSSFELSQINKLLEKPVPTKGITQEFQAEAMRIIEALDIPPNRKSAYFKVVKEEPRSYILQAYSFSVDYPKPELRDQMFFWKLNELKKGVVNEKTN